MKCKEAYEKRLVKLDVLTIPQKSQIYFLHLRHITDSLLAAENKRIVVEMKTLYILMYTDITCNCCNSDI